MRRRVLRVAVTVITVAVLVLGLPLGYAIARLVSAVERSELERAALQAALEVTPASVAGDPIELSPPSSGVTVGVYGRDRRRVGGAGPRLLDPGSARALDGTPVSTISGGDVVEAVPVGNEERVIAVVRASSSRAALRWTIAAWWAGLLGVGLLAITLATLLAARESRRLTRPVVALAASATRLGDGDFAIRAAPSGVPEVDSVAAALERTADRLGEQLDRERAFAARVSHQLRTPLTQLRLELEAGLSDEGSLREATAGAVDLVDHLTRTVDDVMKLSRATPADTVVRLVPLVEECARGWRTPLLEETRPLRILIESDLEVTSRAAACRQVLQILLDNAWRHGEGAVTIRLREAHGAAAIDVCDEGLTPQDLTINPADDGVPGRASGMGLAMARTLAAAEGGRLLHDTGAVHTRFTFLLPLA